MDPVDARFSVSTAQQEEANRTPVEPEYNELLEGKSISRHPSKMKFAIVDGVSMQQAILSPADSLASITASGMIINPMGTITPLVSTVDPSVNLQITGTS